MDTLFIFNVKTSAGISRIKQWPSHILPLANTKSKAILEANRQLPLPNTHLGSSNPAVPDSKHDFVIQPPPALARDGLHINITGTVQPPNPPDRRPTDLELDAIGWGQPLSGPENANHSQPGDIESKPNSGRASPDPSPSIVSSRQAIATIQPSVKYPYMNRWRVLACSIAFFIQGLNDSAPGALLPYMERYYSVRYAMVSLIFVANACGFIIAAPLCHMLNNRFGRARVLSACTSLNVLAYVALVCQPPFPVVVIAFLLLGQYLFFPTLYFQTDVVLRLRLRYHPRSR